MLPFLASKMQMPSSTALKFSANSTRRAKWYTKLGYFNAGHSISFSMKSIDPQGGHICHFTAFIARIYPMLYVAKNQQAKNTDNPNASRTGDNDNSSQFLREKIVLFDFCSIPFREGPTATGRDR